MADADGKSDPAADAASQLREALRFLSHDAREGHSSALALIELQRVRADGMSASELAQRIERNARRALMRIDDFVSFARARSQEMVMEEIDLLDVIYDSVAESWHAGNERGVRLKVGEAPQEAVIQADRGLLRAAIGRLIQHVLDRCGRGSDLVCTVREEPARWSVELVEVAQPEQSEAQSASPQAADGEHGWAFVQLAIQRLGGEVRQIEGEEKGARFRVALPR